MWKVAPVLIVAVTLTANSAVFAAANDLVITSPGAVEATETLDVYTDVVAGKFANPVGKVAANERLCASMVAPGHSIGFQAADGTWRFVSNEPGKLKPGPPVKNCPHPASAGPVPEPIAKIASAAPETPLLPNWGMWLGVALTTAIIVLIAVRGIPKVIAESTNPRVRGLRNVFGVVLLVAAIPVAGVLGLLWFRAVWETILEVFIPPKDGGPLSQWGALSVAVAAILFFSYWKGSKSRAALVLGILSVVVWAVVADLIAPFKMLRW